MSHGWYGRWTELDHKGWFFHLQFPFVHQPHHLVSHRNSWLLNKAEIRTTYHTNTGLEYRPMFLMPYQALSRCFLYIGDFTYIDVPKLGVLLFIGGKRGAFYMSCTVISPGKKRNLTKTSCAGWTTTSRQKTPQGRRERAAPIGYTTSRQTPPRCGACRASTGSQRGNQTDS